MNMDTVEERLMRAYERHRQERYRISRRLKRLTGKRSVDLLCHDSSIFTSMGYFADPLDPEAIKGDQHAEALSSALVPLQAPMQAPLQAPVSTPTTTPEPKPLPLRVRATIRTPPQNPVGMSSAPLPLQQQQQQRSRARLHPPPLVRNRRSPGKVSTQLDLLVVGHQLPMHPPQLIRRHPTPRQPVEEYVYFYPATYKDMLYWQPPDMIYPQNHKHPSQLALEQSKALETEPQQAVDDRFMAELVDELIWEVQDF